MPKMPSPTLTMALISKFTSAAATFRRRQWLTLGVLACVNLCQGVTFSCIVPFFPGQAKAKGLSTAQIGFLIGIYQLGLAICSPLLGQWMAPLGPSRLFSAGLCLCAAAVASFGGLPLLQTGPAFFWAAFSLRALMAAGFAAYKTSQMAILAQTVPERLASAVGVLEVFSALSYSLGPVLGSALIQFGGFHLPFAVFGLLMFLAGLTSIWLLCDKETTSNAAVVGMPIEQQSPTTLVEEEEEKSGLRLVASVPELWLTSLGLGSQMLCTFFYDASLAEHIIRVDRSPMLAGSLISITAITCTCTSPLWGFLVDRSGRRGFAEFLLLGGALGAALFALLIGPSPLIGFFQLSLPLLAVAFALQGMSLTAMGTPSLKHCLRAAKDRGLDPESAAICGSISGILQGSISLGAFLGNSLGGISVQQIGFEWTGTLAAAFQLPFILGFAGFKARNFVWKFIKQQKTAVAELPNEEEL